MKVHANTAMEAAFVAAGYETNEAKLHRLMAEAITAPDAPGRGISGPSIERFVVSLMQEDNAADLLWELFRPARDEVLRQLFDEILARVKAGEDFGGADHVCDEAQRAGESSPESGATVETKQAVQPGTCVSRAVAAAPSQSAPVPIERHRPPGGGISGMQLVLKHQRESWLKRITIGNKPVASMTREEVERAIRTLPAYSRYLTRIYDAWPPHADNQRVSDWLSDEDGDRMWSDAREGNDVH